MYIDAKTLQPLAINIDSIEWLSPDPDNSDNTSIGYASTDYAIVKGAFNIIVEQLNA
jgi:hypothetical protein